MDKQALYTASPVAQRIAGAAEVDSAPVLRALRKMMASGLVQPSITPQGSSTAPNLFNEGGVYRAAIAFNLSRIGLSDDSVREAATYFDYLEGVPYEGDAATEALNRMQKSGEPFFFHLFVAPDYFRKPADVMSGSFSASQNGGQVIQADAWFITITIPLRGLVANLTETNYDNDQRSPKVRSD